MIKNEIILHNEYVEIIVKSKNYVHKVLLDTEDLTKVGKIRISNTGYAYQCCTKAQSVANLIMNHIADRNVVVDHINANRLDNRKSNLRIVSQQNNTQARKTFVRNNTGVLGVSYRENKNYTYYRVSITNPVTLKRFTKQFNLNKLGKEKAFELAIECLNQKKKEFNYTI